jgi:hypothetical protein
MWLDNARLCPMDYPFSAFTAIAGGEFRCPSHHDLVYLNNIRCLYQPGIQVSVQCPFTAVHVGEFRCPVVGKFHHPKWNVCFPHVNLAVRESGVGKFSIERVQKLLNKVTQSQNVEQSVQCQGHLVGPISSCTAPSTVTELVLAL